MQAKEELKQIKFKMDKVQETLREYEQFKERAEKMTAVISDSATHSNKISDKVGDNASKMADLATLYIKRYFDAEQERIKVTNELDKLEEPYRTILFKRYVSGLNFETIASEMSYSYSAITKLHGGALIKYEKRNEKF